MTCPRQPVRAAHPSAVAGQLPRRGLRRASRVLAAALVTAVALGGCAGQAPVATSSGPVQQGDGTYRVEVVMRDMRFVPDDVTVPAGSTLEIVATNDDSMPHDLVLADGAATPLLARGGSATLTVVVDDDIDGWCSVVGHREAGMTLDLRAGK